MLPLKNFFIKITGPNVKCVKEGYYQELYPDAFHTLSVYSKSISFYIWNSVAELFSWNEEIKKEYDYWKTVYYFADILYEFQKNGYQDGPEDEKFILKFEGPSDIIKYYNCLFSKICDCKNRYVVEINWTKYEQIPDIQEKIASKIVELFKREGIIPYDT